MRTFILCFFWLSLISIGAADTARDSYGSCFRKIMSKKPAGDTITVFTRDNKIISGARPIFISPSALYVDSKMGEGIREISFDSIDKITYAKSSWAKTGFGIAGFSLGAIAGGYLGQYVAGQGDGLDFLDFSRGYLAIIVGLAGGVIGAIGGAEIGEQFTVKADLQCK